MGEGRMAAHIEVIFGGSLAHLDPWLVSGIKKHLMLRM